MSTALSGPTQHRYQYTHHRYTHTMLYVSGWRVQRFQALHNINTDTHTIDIHTQCCMSVRGEYSAFRPYTTQIRYTHHRYTHTMLHVSGWRVQRFQALQQQLQWQNFCSRWTSLVEITSNPDIAYGLFRRQLKSEETPFSASMNVGLVTSHVQYLRKTLTYLLIYLQNIDTHTTDGHSQRHN